MNLPNKLTVLRVIMIPFFVFFMLVDIIPGYTKWIALAIFIFASFTDMFDGWFARKYGLITDFGKFMDPLADKLLVCSALICLVKNGSLAAWMAIIIISREFIISGLRLIASDNGVVIAASYWGKFKTVFQMIMIGMLIGDLKFKLFKIATQLVVWIALILTVISLVDYMYKNREVIRHDKH
ncbi:MAG: CDP-diacylglycerol--glycerol-3-phosphate 3-phosphatidyltransferase [Lachnospiraceae bacterium]|nr:CDP-diacylglycerol--glycerol-3-phosphate 3-phosphatidyltransferase [Lachnospiraceae bacterium]